MHMHIHVHIPMHKLVHLHTHTHTNTHIYILPAPAPPPPPPLRTGGRNSIIQHLPSSIIIVQGRTAFAHEGGGKSPSWYPLFSS